MHVGLVQMSTVLESMSATPGNDHGEQARSQMSQESPSRATVKVRQTWSAGGEREAVRFVLLTRLSKRDDRLPT